MEAAYTIAQSVKHIFGDRKVVGFRFYFRSVHTLALRWEKTLRVFPVEAKQIAFSGGEDLQTCNPGERLAKRTQKRLRVLMRLGGQRNENQPADLTAPELQKM